MQVDFSRTDMADCPCGHKMTRITMGYGRTPFGIFCRGCKTNFFNRITNVNVDGAVAAWNTFVANNPYNIRADKHPEMPDCSEYGCACDDCLPLRHL